MFENVRERDKWEPSVLKDFLDKARVNGRAVTELGFSLSDWREVKNRCGSELESTKDHVEAYKGIVGTWNGVKIRADRQLPSGTVSAADDEKYLCHRWRDTDVHEGPVMDCEHPDCSVRLILGE
jgi:hypothetical protein